MTTAIQPKASAAKSPLTGQPYVAVGFDVFAVPSPGGYSQPRFVFVDAVGKPLPNGAVPLLGPYVAAVPATPTSPAVPAVSEGAAIVAALTGATAATVGETPQATHNRVCAPIAVVTRGIVLA